MVRMDKEQYQLLLEYAERRDAKTYAWLRYLVLLSSGAFAVLVSLQAGKPQAGIPFYALKTAWVSLGLGILLG